MLKENITINYACRITQILEKRKEPVSATEIADLMNASQSYVSKVLSRMVKARLLKSGTGGYEPGKPFNSLTVRDILELCHNDGIGPSATITEKLLEAAGTISLMTVL